MVIRSWTNACGPSLLTLCQRFYPILCMITHFKGVLFYFGIRSKVLLLPAHIHLYDWVVACKKLKFLCYSVCFVLHDSLKCVRVLTSCFLFSIIYWNCYELYSGDSISEFHRNLMKLQSSIVLFLWASFFSYGLKFYAIVQYACSDRFFCHSWSNFLSGSSSRSQHLKKTHNFI